VEAGEARRQHAEVRHRRLAEDHCAGFAHACGRRRIAFGRHECGRGAAERHRHAGGRDVLLDHQRHAVEWALRLALVPAGFGGARLGERCVGIEGVGGLQIWFPRGDAVEHGAGCLDGREGAVAIGGKQLDGAEIGEVGRHRATLTLTLSRERERGRRPLLPLPLAGEGRG
jgi:hypothetical protein